MVEKKAIQPTWFLLTVAGFLAGSALLLLVSFPFDRLKGWVDALAQDGTVERFTPSIYRSLRHLLVPTGIILLSIAAGSLIFRRPAERFIQRAAVLSKDFQAARWAELRAFFSLLRTRAGEAHSLYALLGITLLGMFNRAVLLAKPMGHDETYTFMAFASQGFKTVVSDYHLPNNHVFHTLLVFLSTELFGVYPWAVRLPAFLAGVFLIPATYCVALIFFGRYTALLSAGLAALMPVLIGYATNARGYSMIALFTLLLLGLAAYLKDHKNISAWMVFTLIAALGFYTIPVFLYPFGIVMVWLLLSLIRKDISPEYGRHFLLYLTGSGLAVALLAGLLYSPILASSGIEAITGNNFVAGREWGEFTENIPARFRNTWREWSRDVPLIGGVFLIFGWTASIFFAESHRRARGRLILSAILWLVPVLSIQRVAPWPRVWLFLLPVGLIFSAGGWVGLVGALDRRVLPGKRIGAILLAAGLVLLLIASVFGRASEWAQTRAQVGAVEEITLFLKEYLEPGDVVVTTSPDGVILRYYFLRHGLPNDYTVDIKQQDFQRAFVLVNDGLGQTPQSVLEDRSIGERVNLDSANLIYRRGPVLVYELSPAALGSP